MGAAEEAGKVAGGVVDSLKSQPLALALVVVNVLFLIFLVWVFHTIANGTQRRDDQRDVLIRELQTACAAHNKP